LEGCLERIRGHDLKGEEILQGEWGRLGRGARQPQGGLRGKDGKTPRALRDKPRVGRGGCLWGGRGNLIQNVTRTSEKPYLLGTRVNKGRP